LEIERRISGSEKCRKQGERADPATPTLSLQLVVSIGFQSEGCNEQVLDAKRWLEMVKSMARIVLVTVVEEPWYSCPIPLDRLPHADLPAREVFEDLLYPDSDFSDMPQVAGPIQFASYTWTGMFTNV
jgi:hypothetical protein